MRIKVCEGADGETYYEINGSWFRKTRRGLERCSKPERIVKCRYLTDKEKEYWIKHLLK